MIRTESTDDVLPLPTPPDCSAASAAPKLEEVANAIARPVNVSVTHVPAALLVWVRQAPVGCWQVVWVPSHWSKVQVLVSAVQAVPARMTASAGQVVLVPVQVSAMSHPPDTAARHTVPAFPAGCVQATEPTVPLHTSVVQALPSSVHAVPAALTASAGQVVLVPVQVSARSHSLTAARHTAPAFPTGCVQGAAPVLPLHASVVQALPSSVHAVPAALTVVGQVVLVPVQVWSRSHSLSAMWHCVPALPAGCWQVTLVPSH